MPPPEHYPLPWKLISIPGHKRPFLLAANEKMICQMDEDVGEWLLALANANAEERQEEPPIVLPDMPKAHCWHPAIGSRCRLYCCWCDEGALAVYYRQPTGHGPRLHPDHWAEVCVPLPFSGHWACGGRTAAAI